MLATTTPKIILLNALVPPDFDGAILVKHITLDTARAMVSTAEIESYIGHEATAQLLTRVLGIPVPVNRAMYKPKNGDVALVFRLKTRVSGEVKEVKPEDIEVLLIQYVKA